VPKGGVGGSDDDGREGGCWDVVVLAELSTETLSTMIGICFCDFAVRCFTIDVVHDMVFYLYGVCDLFLLHGCGVGRGKTNKEFTFFYSQNVPVALTVTTAHLMYVYIR